MYRIVHLSAEAASGTKNSPSNLLCATCAVSAVGDVHGELRACSRCWPGWFHLQFILSGFIHQARKFN